MQESPLNSPIFKPKTIEKLKHSRNNDKKLKITEEHFRLLADHAQDIIYLYQLYPEANFLYISPSVTKITGYTPKEYYVDSALASKIVYPKDYPILKNIFTGDYDFEKPSVLRFVRKDGTIIWLEQYNHPIYNEEGKMVSVEGIIRDITERRVLEELHRQREGQEKIKTEFFSNISHELRTPLNIILGTQQLLQLYLSNMEIEDPTKMKLNKHLKTMRQNCNRLIRLVNNLMDITKIDSGYFHLDLHNYNIVMIIESIVSSVKDYVKNKDLSLTFHSDCTKRVIACDTDKIERIMLNLLSNATKFTPGGGKIHIELIHTETAMKIVVEDTGVGIPKDKLNSVFKRFVQVDGSFTRSHEGTGIGLALVKSLVEMHQGTISVESEVGRGTKFIIHLPQHTVEDECSLPSECFLQRDQIEKIKVEFSDIYL
ncbi:PAS domain S-box-containing protein [Anaerovirgula multivorans]|uniref:histidine kinase n=1 Tax=Anaerovirgula multivorans TaxID=312168 RepID=A0A239EVP9_9FIRM|nr:PAS domain-containing sensor histidine kinase [Anaerovirgula multivorans]SNS48746.1 PAS domain S-box-containing protein [Anaerovirgula multivorans]